MNIIHHQIMNTKNIIIWVIPIILFVVNVCVTYILQQFYNKDNDVQLEYLVFYLIFVILIFLFCWVYSFFLNRKTPLIFFAVSMFYFFVIFSIFSLIFPFL